MRASAFARFAGAIVLVFFAVDGNPQAPPQGGVSATFESQSSLVLVPFNVIRDKVFVPDVKLSDVMLLEDGHSRDFSVFEGPATGRRIPLELLLLFDTSTLPPRITPSGKRLYQFTHWDRDATYAFASDWDAVMSKEILNQPGADVRVSVYHFDYNHLERLCQSTADPQELLGAFRRLLRPISGTSAIPLAVPSGRTDFNSQPGAVKGEIEFVGSPGWLYESAIATLKDTVAAPGNAIRMLVVFSEGYAPTTTTAQDAADQAVALGIPVFPVVLDWDLYLTAPIGNMTLGNGVATQDPHDPPRQIYADVRRQRMLESLGELTGGAAFSPPRITAKVICDILESVRNQGLSEYVVGFVPGTEKPKQHRLEIRLKSKAAGKVSGGKREATY